MVSTMVSIPFDDVEVVGALDLELTPTGIMPRRLPAWTRPQIPDFVMDFIIQMPSGVRLRMDTDATELELEAMISLLTLDADEILPAVFDVVIDGTTVQSVATTTGNVLAIDMANRDNMTFTPGEPATVRFEGLPPGSKVVEVWLPQRATLELRDLRVNAGATARRAGPSDRRRWIHYGSSISHCLEATSPTGTWPAIAARLGDVDLLSFGFGGQCMLDQFVARTIRDESADVISLKVGINVVNGDTLRDRTFGPALHGFLDTIREGQPTTPILVVSPIFCPSAETKPGPTVAGPDGKFVTVDGLAELRETCLTLTKIRAAISTIVAGRRERGDTNLHYLDGLQLFGADDAGDLPDDLHPNPAGYARMGERFAALAFGPGGALA